MKIASIQLNITWHDKQANLSRAKGFIQQAAASQCELVILPEMFNTGYSMDASKVVESIDGETISTLCSLAKQHQLNIIAGLAVTGSNSVESQSDNIAVFINQSGELVSQYTKNYPFSLAGEKQVYATGEKQNTYQLGDYIGSTFICYDLRFPELFRKVAKQVDFMVVIASWPSTRQYHWELLLQARAVENQCYVIGVNRIGTDGNQLNYTGGSLVCDPMGKVISTGAEEQEYIETTIDLSQSRLIRKKFPFLNDMKA